MEIIHRGDQNSHRARLVYQRAKTHLILRVQRNWISPSSGEGAPLPASRDEFCRMLSHSQQSPFSSSGRDLRVPEEPIWPTRPKGKPTGEGERLGEIFSPNKQNEKALSYCPCCPPLASVLHKCDAWSCGSHLTTMRQTAEQEAGKSLGVSSIAEP